MRHASRLALAAMMLASASATVARAQAETAAAPARQRIEQRLRQGLWRITKQRVGLTDEQMTRLEQSTAKFDERRRALNMEDRAQRQVLRAELAAGDKADQDRVAAALDRLLQLHRQRLDLQGDEQRELSTFMTPVQRAKFAALQEQLRRRVEIMRRNRAAVAVE